jgi:tyrosinase
VRKNFQSLNSQERQDFVDAVKELKYRFHDGSSISIYDEYVQVHAAMQMEIHMGTAFFPWHRYLVRAFELELQAINPQVTIPYWDFTVDNQQDSSLWAEDFMGGNGDPDEPHAVQTGPFRQGEWTLIFDGPDLRRQFGAWVSTLPTPDQVATGMTIENYDVFPFDQGSPISDPVDPATDSFRNYMAGWNWPMSEEPEMHNRVHNWVAGSMLTESSPNDPVFWLAHSYLDLLWADWEFIHGYDYPEDGPPPGQRLRDPMMPFGVTPEEVLDHHALGYFYDTEGGNRPRGSGGRSGKVPVRSSSQASDAQNIPLVWERLATLMFSHYDQKGNGRLDPGELPKDLRDNLARWDANKDGVIDLQEFQAYFLARMKSVSPTNGK